MIDKSIYQYTFAHARDSGEQEAFWKSNRRNQECATAIDKAIAESRYDQHFYKLPAALDTVSREFGLERVAWVVAATVQHYDYDGRFSRANKDWALHFPIPQDRESHVVLNTHLTILDGFADKVRGTRLHELAQTVGGYEKSHHMAERNRLTWFHSDMGSFAPNPGVTEQRLADRCADIIEKQSVLAQLRAERKAEKAVSTPEKTVEHGYSAKFAEQILDGMEDTQRRGLFSTDEKNLVCNYAFHTGDLDKTRQLAEELAAARFGMQYGGGVHPGIAARVNAEIAAIDEQWARLDAASPIAAVEMSTEQNYNQIDGLRNNMAVLPADLIDGQTHEELLELAPETIAREKPSVLSKIQEAREAAPQTERPTPTKSKEDLSR